MTPCHREEVSYSQMLHQGHLRLSSPHEAIVPGVGTQESPVGCLRLRSGGGEMCPSSVSQLWVEGEQPRPGLLAAATEAPYDTARSQAVEFEANPLGKRRLSTVCRRSCSNTKSRQEREAEGPSFPSCVGEEGLCSQVVNLSRLRTCISTIIPKLSDTHGLLREGERPCASGTRVMQPKRNHGERNPTSLSCRVTLCNPCVRGACGSTFQSRI